MIREQSDALVRVTVCAIRIMGNRIGLCKRLPFTFAKLHWNLRVILTYIYKGNVLLSVHSG